MELGLTSPNIYFSIYTMGIELPILYLKDRDVVGMDDLHQDGAEG